MDHFSENERRSYQRISCEMSIRYLLITHENSREVQKASKENRLSQLSGFRKGTTLDIGGGGVGFISEERLPIGSMVMADFSSRGERFTFMGKVLDSDAVPGEEGKYRQRIKYMAMESRERNRILSFLYERERERRDSMR